MCINMKAVLVCLNGRIIHHRVSKPHYLFTALTIHCGIILYIYLLETYTSTMNTWVAETVHGDKVKAGVSNCP